MYYIKKFLKGIREQLYVIYNLFVSYLFMMRGAWHISHLQQPIVTIFGGAKLKQNHTYAYHAAQLVRLLIEKNISIITGGGPGIMQAANCAAYKKNDHVKSIGISVKGLSGEERNNCADIMLVVPHMFARKWLMTRYSQVFVIFPGGFGTADEMFEILTLMQINHVKRFPIIIFGKDYWNHLIAWVETSIQSGLIAQKDADLLFVTDDVQEASEKIIAYCQCLN